MNEMKKQGQENTAGGSALQGRGPEQCSRRGQKGRQKLPHKFSKADRVLPGMVIVCNPALGGRDRRMESLRPPGHITRTLSQKLIRQKNTNCSHTDKDQSRSGRGETTSQLQAQDKSSLSIYYPCHSSPPKSSSPQSCEADPHESSWEWGGLHAHFLDDKELCLSQGRQDQRPALGYLT